MNDPDVYRRLAALERWRDDMASVEKATPIYAIYDTNAGQSLANNTTTIINYEDVVADPDGLVTVGAAWEFVVPVTGLYLIIAQIAFVSSTAWALGERGILQGFVNGAQRVNFDRKDNFSTGATAQVMVLSGAAIVVCTVGDTIDIRANQNTGGSLALDTTSSFNQVYIAKMN